MPSRGESASSGKSPPDILPAGRNCEGFTRKQLSKKGLTHENLQIVRWIHAHLPCAFTEDASGCSRAGWSLSQLHDSRRAKRASQSYQRCCQHSTWRVLVV